MLPRSIKTLYAVIGLPPSSAGFVQLTVIDVASIFTVTVGDPGASEGEQSRSAEVLAGITQTAIPQNHSYLNLIVFLKISPTKFAVI